ncbi:hypothetical protein BGX28_004623 [Mortierella sp. GBA30]|nr:hypothetical protein BGX28_004623 [Mortierella sp. GBA30]
MLLVIAFSTVEAAIELDRMRAYITQGLGPVLNSPALTSTNINLLKARSLHKRYEVCSTDGFRVYYCNTGFRCSTTSSCAFNFYWIAAVAVGLIILIVLLVMCLRRRKRYPEDGRTSNAPPRGTAVMVTPDPNMQIGYGYQAYEPLQQPQAMYTVPKDDSNLAYQQPPMSYVPYTPPTIYSPVPIHQQTQDQQQQHYQQGPPTYPNYPAYTYATYSAPATTQPYPPTSQATPWSAPPR